MIKTYTEQWRDGTLPVGNYYIKLVGDVERIDFFEGLEWERTKDFGIEEVLGPVPDYMNCKGLIYDSINLSDARKRIDELVSKTDELAQKIHILNEQNTKQHNELCDEIKKNNILKKQLEIATKALKEYSETETHDWIDSQIKAKQALKEMKGVK